MADAVVSRLLDKHLLVVHGDSGCGKSSLIRAGVLPRLEQESARGGVRWRTCVSLPQEDPLWNLAEALAELNHDESASQSVFDYRRTFNSGRRGPEELANLLNITSENNLCILVDQFEELFTHASSHGQEEAQLLTEFLVSLLQDPPNGFYMVLTMRSEFLGACARFEGLAETVNTTQYLLPRMGHEDLIRAICEPAKLFDGQISLALANRLIADSSASQDQLPLIQHGLMLLYREYVAYPFDCTRQKIDGEALWKLDLQQYESKGKVSDLLSAHADLVQTQVEREYLQRGSRTIEDLFRALTDINADGQAIRRPCKLSRLIEVTGSNESSLRSVIDHYRAEGVSFLRPYGKQPIELDDLIDVSHEALIRCWRKVADATEGWLNREFRTGLIWRALLVQADSFERDQSSVLSAVAVSERERWLQRRNPAWAERYGGGWERVQRLLTASAQARDRERIQQTIEDQRKQDLDRREFQLRMMKRWVRTLLALLVATVSLGVYAWIESNRANRAFVEASQQFSVANATREQNEALTQSNQQSADVLRKVGEKLERAASESNADPKLAQTLNDVNAQLTNEVKMLGEPVKRVQLAPPSSLARESASPGARLYIQIGPFYPDFVVKQLVSQMATLGSTTFPVIVAGVQLIPQPPPQSSLRCFQTEDCKEGLKLVEKINSIVLAPKITLIDLTDRYGLPNQIRQGHYELWFSPEPIILRPQQ
nr:ATP-binding protein [Pseudomonas sp. CCOS 191]